MTLGEIEERHPEWRACLAALGAVLEEIECPSWDAALPAQPGSRAEEEPLTRGVDCFPQEDLERLEQKLAASGVPESARGALLPLPLLHACRRRWAHAVPRNWGRGYCPVCGAWPALAETCGVERRRSLRCARCGAAWQALALRCAFCETSDHRLLGVLAPEANPQASIETCTRCRGYLKAFVRLQALPPEQVLLEDLASLELDFAAQARGYRRPDDLRRGAA